MSPELAANAVSLDTIVESLRVATRDSPDSAFVLDRDGLVLMANRALCGSLRVEESTLIGRQFDAASRSPHPERIVESLRTACDGTASRYRGSVIRSSGESFLAEVTMSPIRVAGEVVGVFGTAVDVTVSDERDGETRQGEELLGLAGRLARFGGWSVDAETRQVTVSPGARLILGIPDDVSNVGEAAWALYPDVERLRITAVVEACLAQGESFDLESTVFTTSGEQLTLRTVGEPEREDDGRIIGARGAIWDISDAVAARHRENVLEARLGATLTSITDGIYFLDSEFRLTYANPRALELLRFSETELRTTPIWDLFPEAIDAGYREAFEKALQTGQQVTHGGFYAPTDTWFEVTAYPTDEGLAIYVRDVTETQRAEEETRRNQEQLAEQAALLDSASDGMLVRDVDGTVRYWNPAAAKMYGWTAEEAVGRNVVDLIGMESLAREEALSTLMRDGFYAGELAQVTRDGRTIMVDCRWQVLKDQSGNPLSIFAANTDITDYRREQDARQRAQRMESLGTLAGGIAHDLNNVLTPILMSVQLLSSDETDPTKAEMLATIETAVGRGAEMIRQVLSFARGVEGRRVSVDVEALLNEVLAFSRDSLPPGVSLECTSGESLPVVVGDPTQLVQVLVNLVTNAKDAVGATGRLSVTTERLEITDEFPTFSREAPAGSYVTISVEDDGHGMEPDVVAKVFEPFFTTKVAGKGTGLGLATSLAIVRSHGGFMQVYSEPGRGTRFTVGLPVSAEPVNKEPSHSLPPTPLPQGDGELVLVVDDEETIRSVTSRTLEAHGYRTLLASNGQEAIDLIEHGGDDIDLVLTDMMMPVMDGAATSAYLEEHHPGIPIIAASGLNSGMGASGSVGMGVSRFLAKPYTTSVLLTTVNETLHEHRSSEEGTE